MCDIIRPSPKNERTDGRLYVRAIKRTDGCTKKGTEKRYALISNYCAVCGKKKWEGMEKNTILCKVRTTFR